MNAAHMRYTHWGNGYYWVAFDNGGVGCSFYSSPDGVKWTSQGTIFSSVNPNSYTNEWAMRFLGTTVIAAAFDSPNRTYRSGTLNSNGTVTWSAESAVGPADATFNSMNVLIANGRPIMWRDDATAGGAGALWRGSAIASPTWTKTAANAPAMSTGGVSSGIFTAGALFQTGGANPDDLIVLRSTTVTPYASGNHRLVALKWNAATDTYDASWYNVSTLGGTLTEGATTEVQVNDDNTNQKRFTAVRDSNGNIHAVYVNRNGDMVHYKKAVGFNDSWSRISAGINPAAENINMVSLTAAAGGNLYLFYSKGDRRIYYRRFDGTAWGAERLLQDVSATSLQGSLAPMESAGTCSVGLAFIEGSSPYNIRFTLGVGTCSTLQTTQGADTITVTAPGSFEMTFDAAVAGGAIAYFYDLAEDPGRTYDLAGSLEEKSGPRGLHNFGMGVLPGPNWYNSSNNVAGARAELLESTPTRARIRQESFYQVGPAGAILAGVKGIGDYSVYPAGRTALRWERRTTAAVTYVTEYSELVVHLLDSAPLNGWVAYRELGTGAMPGTGNDALVMAKNDLAGGRTDFLQILHRDWTIANGYPGTADLTDATFEPPPGSERVNLYWDEYTGAALPARTSHVWNSLTYFKPTTFVDNVDPAVTSRRDDYRPTAACPTCGPDPLAFSAGSGWNENTADADFYNESEAAYTLNVDPSSGLVFDMSGDTTTRYSPFFKIRQWRSTAGPPSVTLEGTALVRDLDYLADVKPVSRAHLAQSLRWHSTLQDSAAVTAPDVGNAGFVNGLVAGDFVAARYGNGAQLSTSAQYVAFSTADLDPARGALEFWLQPTWNSTDGVWHDICGFYYDANNFWYVDKGDVDNALRFRIAASGSYYETKVDPSNYSWRAGDWVHLRIEWDDTAPASSQLRLLVNGAEPPNSDIGGDYVGTAVTLAGRYRFGNSDGDATFCACTFDEIHVYGGSPSTPAPLAHGGLTSASDEYLADATRNATLGLAGVNPTRQGNYLYFGAESQFRGLNVVLSTAGAGVATGAMLWEYWNGSTGAWADLKAVGSFTDTSSSFTKNGNVFWTSDPANWAPYSVNGGLDLYYVRAHLPAGSSYSTSPIESRITTDILLFQYCGDITASSQTFIFAPPVPTAVRLTSFSAVPGDGSVTLEWQTGSELDNLGFHLYRGLSADGPWTRLTSSLIPGLGSSPLGQAYCWLDSGLVNGTTYYYRLEDVDTSSKTTSHGPVSATPTAASSVPEPSPPGEGGGDAGGGDGSEREGPGTSSCPSWVLAAAPDALSATCTRHGNPESTSLQILARDVSGAALELGTGGFWALHEASGTVRVFVPGLEYPSDPKAPALPLRRALVDAVVGKGVQLVSAEALDLQAFRDLRPSAVGAVETRVDRDGTLRPTRRALAAPLLSRGYWPREVARLVGTAFQGERKSAVVEITPVRSSGSALVLAGRVRVRLGFTGVVEAESGTGSRGRSVPRRKALFRNVLAQLHTSTRGLYAVTFEELFPGRSRGFSTALLRLQWQGEAVGFHVEPPGPVFGPGSTLYFYAERTASSTEYSSEVAYELVRATGVRMGVAFAPPVGAPVVSSSTGSSSFETNRIYQPGLLEAEDLWQWEYLPSGASRSEGFTLSGVDTASSEPARLVVYLQGGSESGQAVDHHVALVVNGASLGESFFAGKRPQRVELLLPASLLKEGANELSVVNVGDTGVISGVLLDRFEISYPQTSTARQGLFEGVWAEGGTVEVGGISGVPVVLRDAIAEGSTVRWLTGFQSSPGSVRFQAEAGHRYLVVSPEGLLAPRAARVALSTLKGRSNQADYLVIAPRELLEAASPLLERRRSQGLSSRAVAFEEIASEFGHGQASAEAIRSFLSYAYHSWQRPSPRYVVLLGDATDDPRRYQSTSWPSPLPALLVKTSYLWTVSDPALGAVNGEDLLPDLAIGRLPATSREKVEGLVSKLLAWEDCGQELFGNVVFVADRPDAGGDFEADVEDIRSRFLSGRVTTTLKVRELGAATRAAILDSFDEGASLMSYVGHGGTAVWSSANVLNSWDASSLLAQSRQPVLLTMNCLNGYFVAPNLDALPEALLKVAGRGVVAAFSPSGLSLDGPAHEYHRALVQELASGRHDRLGDAVLAAQRDYAETGLMPELLTVYQLLGDPALRIR